MSCNCSQETGCAVDSGSLGTESSPEIHWIFSCYLPALYLNSDQEPSPWATQVWKMLPSCCGKRCPPLEMPTVLNEEGKASEEPCSLPWRMYNNADKAQEQFLILSWMRLTWLFNLSKHKAGFSVGRELSFPGFHPLKSQTTTIWIALPADFTN